MQILRKLRSGLGCWSGLTKEERAAGVSWIKTALEQGYKHLDTASDYGTSFSPRESPLPCGQTGSNSSIYDDGDDARIDPVYILTGTEPTVAKAIKETGVKREDLFITTKLAYV